MAEKGAAGSCRQHQVVVAVAPAVEPDLLRRRIKFSDLPEQHLDVALPSHQLAQRRCNITARHEACGDLVEERLEEVEVALIDQADAHRCVRQGLAGTDACEAPAHDHHMGGIVQRFIRWIELEKKVLRCHGAPCRLFLPAGYGRSQNSTAGSA